jgi:AraC-like DNA-binding protein
LSQEIETRLSYLGFQLIPPRPDLRPYVRAYWLMRRDQSLLGYHEEYMHALGNFGLVFNLGDDVRLNGQPITQQVFLDGTNSQSRKMGFTGHIHLLGIQFQIGSTYPFFGIPLAEMVDQISVVEVLGKNRMMPLYDRVQSAASLSQQIAVLEDWLVARLAVGREPNMLVWDSLRVIRSYGGILSIQQLAEWLFISQRQLDRLYQTQVGLSPKHYARLLRVDAARHALKGVQTASLTDLGLQFGFSDQSHFIREFKSIIGMTPGDYLAHSRAVASKPLLNR